MTLQQTIKENIKEAMRAKEEVRLNVLRNLLSAMTNEAVATGGTPQTELTDEQALTVIKRYAKQRKDSIEQYEKGGREDLVAEEKAELNIVESFLPNMMSKDQVKEIALRKKEELGITDKSKLGIFIGAVMKETKGEADGALVKEVVEEIFN
jgi:uncharacterized protein YqeY